MSHYVLAQYVNPIILRTGPAPMRITQILLPFIQCQLLFIHLSVPLKSIWLCSIQLARIIIKNYTYCSFFLSLSLSHTHNLQLTTCFLQWCEYKCCQASMINWHQHKHNFPLLHQFLVKENLEKGYKSILQIHWCSERKKWISNPQAEKL